MNFRLEQDFPGGVDEVADAFVDPELFAHLRDNVDLGRPELLERVDRGDTVHLRVRYAFTGELTPPLSAVIEPARITWVEESNLDRRTRRTEFHIVADHYPDRLRCAGTVELHDNGAGGTRRVAAGKLEVRAPLIGAKIERAVVEGLMEQATTQARVVGEWLVNRRQAEA
ncbi:MAG TPA: DUF2505 family protein [Acidimicrobiales bacterium]|nr:DUF2505 family protein [Acidimicrobiales bacterium]